MQEILMEKLQNYISENNPDLLLQLHEESRVTEFLTNKVNTVDTLLKQLNNRQPEYIVIDACMDLLTQDLRPSKFNYICHLLEEEFETFYLHFKESGVLKFEAINLINYCQSTFEDLVFNEENETNGFLRYAIIGCISEYLESNKVSMKNVSDELQQPTETEG